MEHPSARAGTLAPIRDRLEVPLVGYRVDARPGDWMLRQGPYVAVISAETGELVDYGVARWHDALQYLQSAAFDALSTMSTEVARIEPVGEGGRVLHVLHRVLSKPLWLHVWYSFEGANLLIDSELVSDSDAPLVAVTLGEIVGWGNAPTWVAGHGSIEAAGSYGGAFIARDEGGVSYALCSTDGRLMARIGSSALPGFYRAARTGERVVGVAPRGRTPRRRVMLAYGLGASGQIASTLPCVGAAVRHRWPLERSDASHVLDVAYCGEADEPVKPYGRFRPTHGGVYWLPHGCFRARLTARGHAPGPWFTPGREPSPTGLLPTAGRLRWTIREGDRPLPAKLIVRGIDGTADPDWGHASGTETRHFLYTQGSGAQPIPPGRYQVSVHHGPEYSAHQQEVVVELGQETELEAELKRVVDTTGWVSADLHVHAMPSFDAPTGLTDRVVALAGVNVEVAVATDHNAVTDYGPWILRQGLQRHLRGIVGDEVTTAGTLTGHFNVFPLRPGSAPLGWAEVAPGQLFRAARARASQPVVVQVNHPRMGSIGYFDLFRLDHEDVHGWLRRAAVADMSFDALEVFNGDDYADMEQVETCLRDWYALLNAGFHHVATGNSDSHKTAYHEAGVPRNWVLVGSDEPEQLSEATFIQALRAGRVIVSSGPFIQLTAAGQPVGSTVAPGSVPIEVRVDAPDWIDISQVDLVVRGKRLERWQGSWQDGRPRFVARADLRLRSGDWIVAVVRGNRSMPHLYRRGARPFAFTNPIWVR